MRTVVLLKSKSVLNRNRNQNRTKRWGGKDWTLQYWLKIHNRAIPPHGLLLANWKQKPSWLLSQYWPGIWQREHHCVLRLSSLILQAASQTQPHNGINYGRLRPLPRCHVYLWMVNVVWYHPLYNAAMVCSRAELETGFSSMAWNIESGRVHCCVFVWVTYVLRIFSLYSIVKETV